MPGEPLAEHFLLPAGSSDRRGASLASALSRCTFQPTLE
jgi:hypothetical protein